MAEKTFPVQVVARCRPLTDKEKIEGGILSFPPSNKEVCLKSKNAVKTYTFDRVYAPDSTQEEVYINSISPIVNETLKGFNCTIFAYGQTGTGKTYTMEGHGNYTLDTSVELSPHAGIIPRAAHEIFAYLERNCPEFTVRVSFLELYNEELVDLLGTSMEPLKIFDDYTRKGITVYNLEEVPVANINDVAKVLDKGLKKRQVAETNLNKTSSRSHCIFSIIIHTKESTPEGEDLLKVGKLNLVDLAGSENVGRSGAVDKRKREAGLINQSLLTLGRVITALTEHSHVPYRESKLTRLLQDSLGGKTKTCIVATLSPSASCFEETASTLDYAFRARNIRNKPEVNQKMTKKALIKEYVTEIERLKKNLSAARDGAGFYVDKDTYEDMEKQIQAARDKVEELEVTIQGSEEALKRTLDLFNEKEVELERTSKLYSETKTVLEKTSLELQSTVSDLQEHKVLLEGHQVLVQEHELTEKILQENQSKLVQTLQETIYDVNGLHGKIDRKQSAEEENKRKIGEFSRYLVGRFSNMDEKLKSIEREQSSMNTNILSYLNNLTQNSLTEYNLFNEQIQSLSTLVQQCNSTMNQFQSSSTSTVSDKLVHLSQLHDSHDNQIQESLSQFTKNANIVMSQLKEKLANDQNKILSTLESTKSMLSTRLLAFSVSIDDIKSQLHSIQVETSNLVELQKEATSKQEKELDAIADTQQEDLLVFKESLMKQISLAMNNFMSSQNTKLRHSQQQVKQSMQNSLTNITTFNDNVSNTSKDLHVKMLALTSEEQEVLNKAVHTVDTITKPLESIVINNEENANKLNEYQVLLTKDITERNSTLSTNLESEFSFIKEELNNSTTQCNAQRNIMNEQYLVARQAIHSATKNMLETSETADSNIRSEVSRTTETVASLQNTVANDVNQVKGDVSRFFSTLKEDKATGSTPKKKKIDISVSNPPIPQKEVILAEFKKKLTIVDMNKENVVNN